MRARSAAILVLLAVLAASPARVAPANDCSLYARLDAVCNCPTGQNYLRDFGLRYCERFRHATGWTPAGQQWRDLTLVCLQDELRKLAPAYVRSCDCKALEEAAFATHAACYTNHAASFCTLPAADVQKIYGIIDAADMRSGPGLRQAAGIVMACVGIR